MSVSASNSVNYYGLLGVTPTATGAQIKAAFRELAYKYHPDRGVCDDNGEKFNQVSEAYEALRDDVTRAMYDVYSGITKDTPEERARIAQMSKRKALKARDMMYNTAMAKAGEEQTRKGIVIERAVYGNLKAWREEQSSLPPSQAARNVHDGRGYTDVTLPMQFHVNNGKLLIPAGSSKCFLQGFFQATPSSQSQLHIIYRYWNTLHQVTCTDLEEVRLPMKAHRISRKSVERRACSLAGFGTSMQLESEGTTDEGEESSDMSCSESDSAADSDSWEEGSESESSTEEEDEIDRGTERKLHSTPDLRHVTIRSNKSHAVTHQPPAVTIAAPKHSTQRKTRSSIKSRRAVKSASSEGGSGWLMAGAVSLMALGGTFAYMYTHNSYGVQTHTDQWVSRAKVEGNKRFSQAQHGWECAKASLHTHSQTVWQKSMEAIGSIKSWFVGLTNNAVGASSKGSAASAVQTAPKAPSKLTGYIGGGYPPQKQLPVTASVFPYTGKLDWP